jgi:hypothetical protein
MVRVGEGQGKRFQDEKEAAKRNQWSVYSIRFN